jgi:hypothetical protein
MSLRFRDGEGNEVVVSGLTPGGDLELGVTGQRKGTVTTGAIAAGDTANVTITFDEELPRDDYEVLLSAGVGFSIGTPYDKTTGHFKVPVKNNGASTAATDLTYDAFVLLDADETNQLRRRVDEVESDLDNKQDKLTFDNTPTADSNNPVTSKGIKAAIDKVSKVTGSICNPNILDNPWFTVNQRGKSSYSGSNNMYTFDRWLSNLGNSIGSISLNPGHVGAIMKSGSKYSNLTQRVINASLDPYIGKKVVLSAIVTSDIATTIRLTLSYRDSSNNLINAGQIRGDFNVPAGVTTVVQTVPTVLEPCAQSYSGFVFLFYPQLNDNATRANVTVKCIKIEASDAGSTIENDAPPNNALELAKCQRYFYRLTVTRGSSATYIPAQLYSNTLALCVIPIPVTMRADPRLTPSDDITSSSSNFRFAYGGTSSAAMVQLTQITMYSRTPGALVLQLNIASDAGVDGSKDNAFLRIANNTGYIDFSADL